MSYRDEIGGYAEDGGCFHCGSRHHNHFNCDHEPEMIGPPTFDQYMGTVVAVDEALRRNRARLDAYKATPRQRAIQADIDRQVEKLTAERRQRREKHPKPSWQLPEKVGK